MNARSCLYGVLLLVLLSPLGAQQAAPTTPPVQPPAPPPVNREFDFWIGEWDVFQNGTAVKIGDSKIEAVSGGHALLEHWSSSRASQTGKSLTSFNRATQQWQQYYVGSFGRTTEYKGALVDGKIVLVAEITLPNGTKALNRGTWTPNPDGSVRQQFETSSDGGRTWQAGFDGLYRRKPAG